MIHNINDADISLMHKEYAEELEKQNSGYGVVLIDGLNLSGDALSVVRNSMASASVALRAIVGMGIAGGVLTTLGGARILAVSASKIYYDRPSGSNLLYALGECALGTVYTITGIATIIAYASLSVSVQIVAGAVASVAGLVLYGLMLVFTIYHLTRNIRFQYKLNELELDAELDGEDKNLQSITGRLLEDTDSEEPSLKHHWKSLAGYTSESLCHTTRVAHIQKWKKPDLGVLIQEARRENMKKIAKQCACIGLILLGIAAVFLSLYCPILFISPMLFAAGASGWLIVDSSYVSEKLGNLFFVQSKEFIDLCSRLNEQGELEVV